MQQQTIIAWMACEECDEGERDSVAVLGHAAVPQLATYLLHGPPDSRVASYEKHLGDLRRRLAAYATTHPDIGALEDSVAYVAGYLANYDALYRSRAAFSLGDIGGSPAQLALQAAAARPLRGDVLQHVTFALDSLWHP